VHYCSRFAAVPQKTDDSGNPVPAYTIFETYAGFMRDGLLYMAETRVYGHPDENEEVLAAMAEGMAESIFTGMISGS